MQRDKSSDAFHIISWNIEGAKREAQDLAHFAHTYKPAMMFLSEPQLFQCDSTSALAPFLSTYRHNLNSEDSYFPELATEQRQAHGGTLVLWHSALDPFITLLPTTSPSVLPLLLSVPGLAKSAHIGIYLPTSSRDQDFAIALSSLTATLESLAEEHQGVPAYIQGDGNVNPTNFPRVQLLTNFLIQFNLTSLHLNHPTHHPSWEAEFPTANLISCCTPVPSNHQKPW